MMENSNLQKKSMMSVKNMEFNLQNNLNSCFY